MPDDRADDDALLVQRVIVLRGEIDDARATEVIAKLLFLQSQNRKQPIELWIDSLGGSVTAGLAVIDTMQKHLTNPVHTRCNGAAHGLAAILLACGEPGHREIIRDAKLSLVPLVCTDPTVANEVYRARAVLVEILADATSRPPEKIAADLQSTRSFTPQEAVDYGLADCVVDW